MKKETAKQALSPRMNRTGIAASPSDGKEMETGAQGGTPSVPGDGHEAIAVRRDYARDAEPFGSVPPPISVKGAIETVKGMLKGDKATFLLDKIAERLAFERGGVRLYEQLIVTFDARGGFEGGPTREQLVRIQEQEADHFAFLEETMRNLGGDPTAETPLADVVGVEAMGLFQVLGDPRRTLAHGLHAIHVAELADNDGWNMFTEVCEDMGYDEIAARCSLIMAEESEHLRLVRRWLNAHARSQSRLFGGDKKANEARPS